MRPKFRIWDNVNKCWYEPTYAAYRGDLEEILIMPSGALCMRTMEGLYGESCFEDRFELMQFTGILDKNGKEIYENDIVKDYSKLYQVTWKNGCTLQPFVSWCCPEHVEIIGNIYEHPHLLPESA